MWKCLINTLRSASSPLYAAAPPHRRAVTSQPSVLTRSCTLTRQRRLTRTPVSHASTMTLCSCGYRMEKKIRGTSLCAFSGCHNDMFHEFLVIIEVLIPSVRSVISTLVIFEQRALVCCCCLSSCSLLPRHPHNGTRGRLPYLPSFLCIRMYIKEGKDQYEFTNS